MTDALSAALATRDWLLADGATGTALFAAGLEAGGAPELWCAERPDDVRALHRGAVEAGSDLFLTNSFGGTASRLKLHGAEARVRELARLAASLGREVADGAGRSVIVAGSMGPTGEILEPVGALPFAAAVEQFHEQAEGLREGGADILWVETISAPEEYRAAAEGARLARHALGGDHELRHRGAHHDGARGSGPRRPRGLARPPAGGLRRQLRRGRLGPRAHGAGLRRGRARPPGDRQGQRRHPRFVAGHVHYDGTPELMGRYAVLARDAGARVIGGCCGTGPEHLSLMRRALEQTPPGPRPELAAVSEALGPFSSEGDGMTAAPARARSGRRRRG